MSDSTPVPAAGVPQFTGNLATLERHITALRKDGTKLATQGKNTHTTFQGLSAYYKAPEADRLFATTTPVSTTAHDIGADMGTIADALDTYATEVRPLAKRLAELKADAQTFANAAAADDTWREDGDKVEENNERRDEISRTLEAFWTAEIECHSKIVKLVNGRTYSLNDGSKSDHLYGYRADDLKGAKGLPWGDPVVESVRWYQAYEHVADFATGVVVDGVWGTVTGLGTLVGVNGWDAAGEAWTGLAKLATGVAVMAVPGASLALSLHGGEEARRWVKDSQTALKETGKALVAWDQWGSNPGRAAGLVTFNVVTTVFTGGVGAGVSGAGKAGAVAKALSVAGKAGRVIDPTTYVFKAGAYTGIKISDFFGSLKNSKQVDVGLPPGTIELPEGTLRNADGTVTLPADATPPKGAVEQPNGTYTLSDDAVSAGSLRNPDGSGTYLTPRGDVINGKGEVLARVEDAPGDVVNTPATRAEAPGTPSRAEAPSTPTRAETPAPERVLVSVGADTTRAGPGGGAQPGDTARLGGNIPDRTPRMSHDTPGSSGGGGTTLGDTTTGGGARTLSGNAAVDLSRGGSGAHDAPGGSRGGGSGGGGTEDVARAGDDASGNADDGFRSGDPDAPSAHQAADGSDVRNSASGSDNGLTTAERKTIQDEHVRLANQDPEWFKQNYDILGRRRPHIGLVDGVELPQIAKDPNGQWVAKHNLPSGPTETGFGAKPLDRASAPDEVLSHLDKRMADREAYRELMNAEKAFDAAPTATNGETLRAARKSYDDLLPGVPPNSKIPERLGEDASRLHAIRTEFPDAQWIELPKTPNGANMFDGAYRLKDDEILIVEDKAPGNGLDWRQGRADPDVDNPDLGDDGGAAGMRVKQGTRPYLRTIMAEMARRGGADGLLAKEFRDALRVEKLRYVVVKVQEPKGSQYAGVILEDMKIY